MSESSFDQETERAIRLIINDELMKLSDKLQPGSDNPLKGFDPDYETKSLHLPKDLNLNETDTDGEMRKPLSVGETVHFDFTVTNKVDADKVYGVVLKTAGTPKEGSFTIMGPGKDGAMRFISGSVDDFNTPVGRFFSGTLRITGTIENGKVPGHLEIAYGDPVDEADLPGSSGSVDITDPDIVTGTDSLHVDTAGVYIVTVTTTVVQDTVSATLSGESGGGYIRTTLSDGPPNDFPILGNPTGTIE